MSGRDPRMTPSTFSAKSVDELRIGTISQREGSGVGRHRIDRRTKAPTPPLTIAHAGASTGSTGRSDEAVFGAQALQAPKEAPPGERAALVLLVAASPHQGSRSRTKR